MKREEIIYEKVEGEEFEEFKKRWKPKVVEVWKIVKGSYGDYVNICEAGATHNIPGCGEPSKYRIFDGINTYYRCEEHKFDWR